MPAKIIQFPKIDCRKNVLIEINLTIHQRAEIWHVPQAKWSIWKVVCKNLVKINTFSHSRRFCDRNIYLSWAMMESFNIYNWIHGCKMFDSWKYNVCNSIHKMKTFNSYISFLLVKFYLLHRHEKWFNHCFGVKTEHVLTYINSIVKE